MKTNISKRKFDQTQNPTDCCSFHPGVLPRHISPSCAASLLTAVISLFAAPCEAQTGVASWISGQKHVPPALQSAAPQARYITDVTSVGPYERVITTTGTSATAAGPCQGQYVELGPNTHQQDPATGEWLQAWPTIQATNDGAALDFGGFHASFAANHHSSGAFSVTTPTGETLAGQVLGVCYQDMASGLSGFIASTKDSIGAVQDGKRVVYHDAFSAISADLVYDLSKGAVEQDVVFSASPPDPTTFGMNPTSTLVQVVTEFLAPPQPSVDVRYFTNTMCSANGTSIAVEDNKIEFESVAFGFGQSFARCFDRADRLSPTVVQKWWRNIGGRAVLIESVPYVAISAMAKSAGLGAPAIQPSSIAASPVLQLPPVPNSAPGGQMLLVTNAQVSPGVVMDWIAVPQVNGSYTFNSGTTYVITGETYFNGPVTLALGTIIKYNHEACINFSGGVAFNGGPHGWTVLTAVDDQTVGEAIPNSAPVPSGYYADWAMVIWGPGGTPQFCDVRFANRGIFFYTGGSGTIVCVNSIGCGTAAGGFGTTVYWEGGYWCDVSTSFEDDYEATLAAYPNSLAVDLLGLANGQVVSGSVALSVVFGNTDPNGNVEAFVLTDSGGDPPLTGTSFPTTSASGDCVLGTWDTTQIANGNYRVVAKNLDIKGQGIMEPGHVTFIQTFWQKWSTPNPDQSLNTLQTAINAATTAAGVVPSAGITIYGAKDLLISQ
jgi:hypothetical protein